MKKPAARKSKKKPSKVCLVFTRYHEHVSFKFTTLSTQCGETVLFLNTDARALR